MGAEPGEAAAPVSPPPPLTPLSKLSDLSCHPLFLGKTKISHCGVFSMGALVLDGWVWNWLIHVTVSEPQFPILQMVRVPISESQGGL